MGSLLHSPWVKDKVKTNELPIRGSLSERDVYFCLNSLFLLFTQSAFLFFFSVCLPQFVPLLPPSTSLLAQQAQTHTHCITHTHREKGGSVMGTEGCNWSKSRLRLCAYLDNNAVQNNRTSLHFNVVFLSFCAALSFLLVHSVQSFEKLLLFLCDSNEATSQK